MESTDHSYIFVLPDDIKVKIIKEMSLENFVLFLSTYPKIKENEYSKDILKHFYLEYKLPICTTFEELIEYSELTDIDRLKVIVIRDDINDFNRLLSNLNLSLDKDDVNCLLELLEPTKSSEMMRLILDNTDEYELYMPILKSQDPDLIRYLLDKMGENNHGLDSEYEAIVELAKSILVDNKNKIAIDIIAEYHPDGYTDAIVGFIEGYNEDRENNSLCKDFATEYILNSDNYDIETIFEGLGLKDQYSEIEDELEEMIHIAKKFFILKKLGLE